MLYFRYLLFAIFISFPSMRHKQTCLPPILMVTSLLPFPPLPSLLIRSHHPLIATLALTPCLLFSRLSRWQFILFSSLSSVFKQIGALGTDFFIYLFLDWWTQGDSHPNHTLQSVRWMMASYAHGHILHPFLTHAARLLHIAKILSLLLFFPIAPYYSPRHS